MNKHARALNANGWRFPASYGWRSAVAALALILVLGVTALRLDIGGMIGRTGGAIAAGIGVGPPSPVADGMGRLTRQMWPIRLAEAREVSRISGFDPDRLPLLAHLETRRTVVRALDPITLRPIERVEESVWLVEPLGYAGHVAVKLIETIEIALWGTIVAMVMGLPLALAGAENVMRWAWVRASARAVVAVLRALPELVSALFLVVAYGFGPIPGVLALGLHGAGFLGKFYADEMENADRAPQRAMTAMGMGGALVWRHAVLPQVLPQFVAYTLYILDRNVRMATVIGLVGAGGIGQELKGRFDLYEYDRVATILIAILIVIVLLDQLARIARKKLLA